MTRFVMELTFIVYSLYTLYTSNEYRWRRIAFLLCRYLRFNTCFV